MELGWFTGRKLKEFIDEVHCDYASARKVIDDKASVEIAQLAKEFESFLIS